MPIEQLPVTNAYYDVQRFTQHGSQDLAGWYGIEGSATKGQYALYPTMGTKHIDFLGINRLIFPAQPRFIYKSINYVYVFVGIQVYQIDRYFNVRILSNASFDGLTGDIWFSFLAVGSLVYCMFTALTSGGRKTFVIQESLAVPVISVITDTNAPENPTYVAAFGSRFVVSVGDSSQFYLSRIGLDDIAGTGFSASEAFSYTSGSAQVPLFASASGKIGQFAVLHNQLYILCDYVTDIWANIPTQIGDEIFPWKLNTSYNFDYGIADPHSLDVSFGMMAWLARNHDGVVAFMVSTGQQPDSISTQAINVLLQKSADLVGLNSNNELVFNGFLYQYEDSIFYRVSWGTYTNEGQLDLESSAKSIEFNFDIKNWHRCIELNGERSRIQRHVFFNGLHLVIVEGENVVYNMGGNIYYNELRNPDQDNPQADDAFLKYPLRYELVTRQIYDEDYSEFITDYVEIDFVFGDRTFYESNAPFDNTIFIVDETSTPEVPVYLLTEDDAFIIAEDGNTPQFDDTFYNKLFKPHIELYISDDGGVTFYSADNRKFSPLGAYRWRMRWYQLGASRNRCYKLICVSSAPIVVLGAVQNRRRASGGAN